MTSQNINNDIRTKNLNFFKANGVQFKDDKIEIIYDLQWTFEDAVTGEYLTTIDPSFKLTFKANVVDGKNKQADNINLKIVKVEAVPSTHQMFPTSDTNLFVSILNRFSFGIQKYLDDNVQVFGLGFTNYILSHYENVFSDYQLNSLLVCGKNSY